jgi:hypothetical protein
MKNLFFILLLVLSANIFAQKRDSISLPDTAYYLDQIYRIDDGTKTRWGFYENDTKKWITEPVYDTILFRYRAGQKLAYYEIRQNGKWGMLKKDRTVWIPALYDRLDYKFQLEPQRIIVQSGNKTGVLNTDASFLLEPVYDEIQTDGYEFKVKKNGKWGLLTKDGKAFIPVCYDKIYENATPQLSLVQNGSTYWSVFQWIQNSSNPCQPEEKYLYERIEYFNEFFTVFKDGKWGLVDNNSEPILKMEYEEMKPFVFSYLRTLKVKQNGKYGLIQIDSAAVAKKVAELVYDDIGIDDDSYKIRIAQGNMKDYLFDGKPYFDLVYNDVLYFSKYRQFTIKSGKKWGVALENKKVIIKPGYDKIMFIDARTYMVQKGTKWGVIDNQDRVMIPIDYTEFDFRRESGYFFAAKKGKWGIVSLREGVVLPSKYDDLMVLPNNTFLVQFKGKVGVVGVGDRIIVPIEYDDVDYREGDVAVVLKHKDGRKYRHRIK